MSINSTLSAVILALGLLFYSVDSLSFTVSEDMTVKAKFHGKAISKNHKFYTADQINFYKNELRDDLIEFVSLDSDKQNLLIELALIKWQQDAREIKSFWSQSNHLDLYNTPVGKVLKNNKAGLNTMLKGIERVDSVLEEHRQIYAQGVMQILDKQELQRYKSYELSKANQRFYNRAKLLVSNIKKDVKDLSSEQRTSLETALQGYERPGVESLPIGADLGARRVSGSELKIDILKILFVPIMSVLRDEQKQFVKNIPSV